MTAVTMKARVTEGGNLVMYDDVSLRSFVFVMPTKHVDAETARKSRLVELEQLRQYVKSAGEVGA